MELLISAALYVSSKETWRRSVIWRHVQYFASLTKLEITSPIISIVVGSEAGALRASRYLLRSGFHVTPIRPPTVPPNSCRSPHLSLFHHLVLSYRIAARTCWT
ncbi:8-amino-7-oxononanoate synthase [Zea mays]|uniref:8-amino-7-oxononanoate synthase n=1 Tax=Zea mays TaxID=4577 RepID=A0A1D6JIN8_MAIZE|nr:8-amino-7-oxononanoate synthase [Zea mays]AQK47456.1 8-amino-7-oxononanoate synthase [Zea mays]